MKNYQGNYQPAGQQGQPTGTGSSGKIPPSGGSGVPSGVQKKNEERTRDHYIHAALAYCRQEATVRALKSTAKCEERPEGQCDTLDPGAIRCDACQSRFENRPKYKRAIRRRSNAKQSMMHWYSRIEGAFVK